MRIEWADVKAAENLAKHGVGFGRAIEFPFQTATTERDTWRDYGEERLRAFGQIDGRLYVIIYTWRDGAIRVISLRKANPREERRHGG